jgi:hypothetical protein
VPPDDGSCFQSKPDDALDVRASRPAELEVTSPVSGTLAVEVRDPADGMASMPRDFPVRAGRAASFGLSDVDYDTTFAGPGTVVVCS